MHELKVVFFASLREAVGIDGLTLTLDKVMTIEEIKQLIGKKISNPDPLFAEGIQASIDFNFARPSSKVDAALVKEVAFFPPVTGG
ncbi:molybdenum cofactor biosynthesis protein C [Marinomonas sp. MED121]|uniref:MoaD/ThiS family protein n=1 Tax=Marinomonas sp. MED121 TaxID=314277 RepID=UPI000068FA2F|nr:MoaD/ThiS family protein [Marinomonas sp. MED121]EAQ64119.1 molybdenum cofactor biosynthesis protein C [Marinomonas sp. MED121]